jgi:hypothetical protein
VISEVTSEPVTGITVTSANAVEDAAMIPPASEKAKVKASGFPFMMRSPVGVIDG